jgi:hypothetical protein
MDTHGYDCILTCEEKMETGSQLKVIRLKAR